MKLEVECYSGHKADERPARFRLEGRQYAIEEVLDQSYEPESISYKVRADDSNSTSFAGKHRRRKALGNWCRSGKDGTSRESSARGYSTATLVPFCGCPDR